MHTIMLTFDTTIAYFQHHKTIYRVRKPIRREREPTFPSRHIRLPFTYFYGSTDACEGSEK